MPFLAGDKRRRYIFFFLPIAHAGWCRHTEV